MAKKVANNKKKKFKIKKGDTVKIITGNDKGNGEFKYRY